MSDTSLELDQDLDFQRREWSAQRWTWALSLLVLLLAVAGLLGPGPLSHESARAADGAVEVDYLRWARRGAAAPLTVHANPDLVRDGELVVAIPAAYFDDMELRGVTPAADRVEANGDQLHFVFTAPSPSGRLRVDFDVHGRGMGPLSTEMVVGGTAVGFAQFLWP